MMITAFSVAVLISAGRHPVSGAPRSCRGDAVAMALGRRLVGDALRVVHAGAAQEPCLQDYLAFGAENIEVLPIDPAGDVTRRARLLFEERRSHPDGQQSRKGSRQRTAALCAGSCTRAADHRKRA